MEPEWALPLNRAELIAYAEELRSAARLLRMVAANWRHPHIGGVSAPQVKAVLEWYERQ